MTGTFLSKIDRTKLDKLCEDSVPVDALNLVRFSNAVWCCWYGPLLFPLILLRGGRPLFIGVHERSFAGKKTFDELFIIRYPRPRNVIKILIGKCYDLLSIIREKSIRYFEFSFTTPFRDSSELRRKGPKLVLRFNYKDGTFGNVLDKITNILGKYPVVQLYASRKIGDIPFNSTPGPSDPSPCEYEGMVIFSILEGNAEEFKLEEDTITNLETATAGLVIDIYRSRGVWIPLL